MIHHPKIYWLVLLLLVSCKTSQTLNSFETAQQTIQSIAILPFDLIFTGPAPQNLSVEDFDAIESLEQKALQMTLYLKLIEGRRYNSKDQQIKFQYPPKTNMILHQNGIGIDTFWKVPPQKIAELLEVDAVFLGRMEKSRLFSDFSQFDFDIEDRLVAILADNTLVPWFPLINSQSKIGKFRHQIYEASQGEKIWFYSYSSTITWQDSTKLAMENLVQPVLKSFPFKKQ